MTRQKGFQLFFIWRCPVCFVQNISLIGPVVLKEKSFEWFLPKLYGHDGHLVFWIMTCFYTPVEDGSYYVVPSIRPSVRLSDRPSVRPLTFRVRSITLIPSRIFS